MDDAGWDVGLLSQKMDPAAFTAFHGYLEKSFPECHKVLRRSVIADYRLVSSAQRLE